MSKLRNLYKKISTDTWHRMRFALETNSKISEITLTENLLYMINKYIISSKDTTIRIFEAKDEKTNGNDLEIYLKIDENSYILLVVQAKKLYTKTQKYKTISHKVGTDLQIDSLIKYADITKGLPLYLLYNYAPDCTRKNKEYLGCTLIHASDIKSDYAPRIKKRWKIPTFEDLHSHNHAVAWYLLAYNSVFKRYVKDYNKTPSLKGYKEDELINDEWFEVKEYTKYKEVATYIDIENSNKRFFKPKFRVLIKLEEDNKK